MIYNAVREYNFWLNSVVKVSYPKNDQTFETCSNFLRHVLVNP